MPARLRPAPEQQRRNSATVAATAAAASACAVPGWHTPAVKYNILPGRYRLLKHVHRAAGSASTTSASAYLDKESEG